MKSEEFENGWCYTLTNVYKINDSVIVIADDIISAIELYKERDIRLLDYSPVKIKSIELIHESAYIINNIK